MSAPDRTTRPARSRVRRALRAAAMSAASLALVAVLGAWAFPTSVPVARTLVFLFGAEYLGRDGVTMQQGDEDCGIAALEMMLAARGVAVPALDSARAEVLARAEGASLLELQRLAAARGVRADGWRLNLRALERAPLPALVHLGDHFAVVDRVDRRGVELRDPSLGRIRLTREDFVDVWTGDVLLFPPAAATSKAPSRATPTSPAATSTPSATTAR